MDQEQKQTQASQGEERYNVDAELGGANAQAGGAASGAQQASHFWQRSWFWIVVVIIAGAIAYGAFSGFSFSGLLGGFAGNGSGNSNGDVVAVVNGEEITQEEFDARLAQAQANAQGGDVDQAQLLETMINTELIMQDAETQGITVSDQEVEEYYQNQVLSGGTTEEQLQQQLSQSGFSVEDLKNDIRSQLVVQAYVEANAGGGEEVTDQQVQDYYDQLAEQQPEGSEFPPLADVEGQIKQQLQSQQQNQIIGQVIEQLRADAEITNNLSSNE